MVSQVRQHHRVAILSGTHIVEDSFAHDSAHLFKLCGGNTGNFAIIASLYWHLRKLTTTVDIVPWDISPELARDSYDLIVFACANMLGQHTDLGGIAARLQAVGRPIIAIGLGAQADSLAENVTITPGTRRWLEVVVNHAPNSQPNIGVRGEFTLAQLERLGFKGNAKITGCTSNLMNPRANLAQILQSKWSAGKIERVAVAAGLPYWPQLMLHERELIQVVERTSGLYVTQHDIDMIRISRDEFDHIPDDRLKHLMRYLAPNLDDYAFRQWFRRNSACFNDASSWLEAMRKYDFVVGPRFHGIMMSLQAGTPGGVITHDSRTQELCKTMCIPAKHYSEVGLPIDESRLHEIFPFDASSYIRQRSKLCGAFIDILQNAGLGESSELKEIRETTA